MLLNNHGCLQTEYPRVVDVVEDVQMRKMSVICPWQWAVMV